MKFLICSKWQLFIAKLFGKKIVGVDYGSEPSYTVTAYRYRGQLFIVSAE